MFYIINTQYSVHDMYIHSCSGRCSCSELYDHAAEYKNWEVGREKEKLGQEGSGLRVLQKVGESGMEASFCDSVGSRAC